MRDSARSEKKAAHRAKMKEAKRKAREKRDGQKDEPQNPEPPQNSEPQLEIYAVNYNFIRAPWLRF